MKKILAMALALMMALSLAACGGSSDTPAPSGGGTTEPDTSSQQPPDTSAPASNQKEEWYYQGFQLDFNDTQWSGSMYCDGESLWYIATSKPQEGVYSSTQRFSVEPADENTFLRSYHFSDRPVETRIYDGEALDHYFNKNLEYDNYGRLLNNNDTQFFDFSAYEKTDQTETVAGRKCTIYRVDSTEYERSMSIDDEFGIVMKIRDTFYVDSGDGVYFEVTNIQFGAAQPPDDVVIKAE